MLENVLPQMRFARDCLAAGVGRLVFVSSGGTVYGPPRYLPIDEAHPTDPLNSHGLTKLMTEKYLGMLAQTRGLDAVVLRVANPFGPTQGFRKGQGLIPAILERQRRGLPVHGLRRRLGPARLRLRRGRGRRDPPRPRPRRRRRAGCSTSAAARRARSTR